MIGCGSALRRDDIPERFPFQHAHVPGDEWINPGVSTIIGADGKFIVEPVKEREENDVAGRTRGSGSG